MNTSMKFFSLSVALNYQTEGRMMQLNRAKFMVNGGIGYVLKPPPMCKGTAAHRLQAHKHPYQSVFGPKWTDVQISIYLSWSDVLNNNSFLNKPVLHLSAQVLHSVPETLRKGLELNAGSKNSRSVDDLLNTS